MFLESLELNCLELDSMARPECLDIKAKLISKYYSKSGCPFRLGHHNETTNILIIYTHNIVIVLIFDCPDLGLVHMSWSPIITNSDGPETVIKKSCGLDDTMNECEKVIELFTAGN